MTDLSQIKGVILDMDGVLWRGAQFLPGVPEVFKFFDQKQIGYVFATNNSSQPRDYYVRRWYESGVKITARQVITSASATAGYLRRCHPAARRVFVVGGTGLRQALHEAGFDETEEQAEFVIVGIDRELTYEKLRRAVYQIQGGAVLIGSNRDATFPEPHGFAPGAGSILAAIETATGKQAVVVGKPELPMFEQARDALGLTRQEILMIGDRLETDIAGGRNAGMLTALVLTGVSTRADIEATSITPDMVFSDLDELIRSWGK